MRIVSLCRLSLLTAMVLIFFSCTKQTEEFETETVSSYLPLQKGKFITYRLDSTVTTQFGLQLVTHSYQVKHVVDEEITDNLGRPSYRIYRYLNNVNGTGVWTPNGSYLITPTEKNIEVIEDNLRFIKLASPMKEGTTWHGNSYLSGNPYELLGYGFTSVDYMKNWDYYYDSFQPSYSYQGNNYSDVWIVEQSDDIYNFPVTNPAAPGSKFRGQEIYSKDIGLVYREYALFEYEANPSGANPFFTGFGITMWMIDHN